MGSSREPSHTFSGRDQNRPIASAPRNGLSILVGDEDAGQFIMHWEPTAENGLFPGRLGFWVALDRSMTWSEHDGAGPTYWRPLVEAPANADTSERQPSPREDQ